MPITLNQENGEVFRLVEMSGEIQVGKVSADKEVRNLIGKPLADWPILIGPDGKLVISDEAQTVLLKFLGFGESRGGCYWIGEQWGGEIGGIAQVICGLVAQASV